MEAETVWDFLRYNWRPFTANFRESLIVNMLSLILDLYQLDSLKVDVTAKLLEIKNEKIKGNMEKYQKLMKSDSQVDIKLLKKAFLRIRKTRQELANLSAESRLALFAKQKGFDVVISKSPDLLINKKRVEVKRPKVLYADARKKAKKAEMNDALLFLQEEQCTIEDIASHIRRGFKQGGDIVAIEVHHLDKRPISGFSSKWLGNVIELERALLNAVNYDKKGIVLLFKCRRANYQGRVIRCKEIKNC